MDTLRHMYFFSAHAQSLHLSNIFHVLRFEAQVEYRNIVFDTLLELLSSKNKRSLKPTHGCLFNHRFCKGPVVYER